MRTILSKLLGLSEPHSPADIEEFLMSVKDYLISGIIPFTPVDAAESQAETDTFREHSAKFDLSRHVVESFRQTEFLGTTEEFEQMMGKVTCWRGLTNNIFKFHLDERLALLQSIEQLIQHSTESSPHYLSGKSLKHY